MSKDAKGGTPADDLWGDEPETAPGEDGCNEFALFDGDHGDMSADARDAAIALKTRTCISGALFEKALAHLDEVERSLNNDMLLLTVDEHYGLMYASPVDVDLRGGHYSLKRTTYLGPQDASALVMLRQHVLAYENERTPPEGWLISYDEIEMELTTGSGFLAGRNSEEDVDRRLKTIVDKLRAQGYLDPTEEDGMYLIDPLVPSVVTKELQEQWLAILSGTGEEGAMGPTARGMAADGPSAQDDDGEEDDVR